MKLLFLRGQVPQDRNPQEIIFDELEKCDDVWTHLAYSLLREKDTAEIWYWGGQRTKVFKDNFTEKWIRSFKNYDPIFNPDVIFCRGGFPEYNHILNQFPDAFKIYYGAGRRYIPDDKIKYDLILQDSQEQLEKCRSHIDNAEIKLFIKPAPENLFYPMNKEKEFDIVFPASGRRADKGINFVFDHCPNNYKVLHLGYPSKAKMPNHFKTKRVLRTNLLEEYSRCKVGIICSDSSVDSCPRVIPELLASNIPIIVLDETRFWKEKYITDKTGIISNRNNFWNDVKYALDNLDQFEPRKYYDENLSMKISAEYIRNLISC